MILNSNPVPLDSLKYKTLVIASQNEPFLSCDRNVCGSSEIGNIRMDHGRIGNPIVKKYLECR